MVCRLVLPLVLLLVAGCAGNGTPSPANTPTETPSPTPTLTPTEVAREIVVDDGATAVTVRSSAASLRIDKGSAAWTLEAADGTALTQSAAAPTLQLGDQPLPLQRVTATQLIVRDNQTRGVELTCDAGDVTVVWSIEFLSDRTVATRLRPATDAPVTRIVTMLRAAADEHFYGLTERIIDNRGNGEFVPKEVGTLDRRGETVMMTVTPTIALYTPFFHSSRGYGVYVEGTMPGVYDLAKSDPNAVAIDFQFNPRTGVHGVVFFVGGYDAVLDEYTALTGRPFVPPRWAFLHLRWRDEHRIADPAQLNGVAMNADFVNDITMYEALGIPPGNYEFDRPWTDGTTDRGEQGFASFHFDPARFPNTDAMLAALKNRGYHVLVFGAPWALGDNAVDAEQFGYYAPRTRILIDYTNPAAVAWWTGKVQSLIDLGISGMKLDRSEFALTEIGDVVPDQATDVFADGRNGVELRNGYTLEYAKVHYNAFADRLGDDFFHYFRTGYAGSQRYGIFWGGDITGRNGFGTGLPTDLGLRSAILSLARVAFMGFPIWGTDTGGYYQFGDRDVFARWLEFSALCPLMEIGGGNQGGGQHAPWDMPTEPHNDTEMIDIYRRFVTLHHELVPLLYSLALEAHANGRPLARPLVFDYPADPAVANLWDEFRLGDLLVAPLWQSGARSRDVYLPQGTWIDYWNPAQRLTGPATVTVDAPLDRIPLYVRAGGMLPFDVRSDVTGNGSAASAGRLTIDAYPSGDSAFTLHEAEGDTTFGLHATQCSELVHQLNGEMAACSAAQEYEKALSLRNQIGAIGHLSERQYVERPKESDQDVIAYTVADGTVSLMVFAVRKGSLTRKQEYSFEAGEEFFEEFLVQYYADHPPPPELILSHEVDAVLNEYLTGHRGSGVQITVPKIGEKKKLLDLVYTNIELSFHRGAQKTGDLQTALELPDTPQVIECFDISHLSGTSMVGSMVQFRDGMPDKKNYRRFKIRTVEGIDDVASIAEIVKRRYQRLSEEDAEMPDLIVIDGGKGQLSAALAVLTGLGRKIPVIALAKRLEEVYVPGEMLPRHLDPKGLALRYLQEIRNEAHRFAVAYHRLLRRKKAIH